MGNIAHFIGRDELSAKENLKAYAEHAKRNFPLKEINWSSCSWDITTLKIGRAQGKTKRVIHFRSVRDESRSQPIVRIPFKEPFLEFAKSTLSETIRRFQSANLNRYIYALQAIEQALINANLEPCITQLTPYIMDAAAEMTKARYKDAWGVARVLERIVTDIINPARLTPILVEWRSPIAYKAPVRNDRITTNSSPKESKRLPSVETILALADIHHNSTHVSDRITTCFVTLAMYAPSRSAEILSLPLNCLRIADSAEGLLLGISWSPAKGAGAITKFSAADEFEEVVKTTVKYLADLGAPARVAAAWYARNPGKLYLPPGTEHLRDLPLTLHEVAFILGKKGRIYAGNAGYYGLVPLPERCTDKSRMRPSSSQPNWVGLYDFSSLEKFVLAKLPRIFPILDGHTGLKWHEALFMFPLNILMPKAEPLLNIPTPLTTSQLNNQLGSNPGGQTVFSRNGHVNLDGSPVTITTHHFRHLLNTLAQSKHLSEALIAFWSGRKSIKQNEWYDHLPQEAFIEAYLKLGGQARPMSVEGHLKAKVESIAINHALTHDDALRLELGATHRTRYGICRHDYAIAPCPNDKDCISCTEHTFVKGDSRHYAEAIFQQNLHVKAVADAERAVEEGQPGATRWLKLNQPKLERWRLVLEMMNDPSIPDGTLLTLPPSENSQSKAGLAQAVRVINIEAQTIDMQPADRAPDEDEELLIQLGVF